MDLTTERQSCGCCWKVLGDKGGVIATVHKSVLWNRYYVKPVSEDVAEHADTVGGALALIRERLEKCANPAPV